ncbi:hypothetical protein NDU88_002729 [Pleurodeles waltl]|uniref:Uncharacterized protein n=1 Tax=Pleurodeles waltl TaxID=8319 RepID=A0AAV7LKZ2_PLEWA|nr:hypothetical protein NDU88_002729 [Pleurodeles waltl]
MGLAGGDGPRPGGTTEQQLSHAPDLEQIIRDGRSALRSVAAIRDPTHGSDQEEEGTDNAGGAEDLLSGSLSETGTVTPPVVTRQIILFE